MTFDVALAEEIWTSKYRFKTDDGGDSSFAETAARVARAVAAATVQKLEDIILTRARDLRRTTVSG